MTFQIFSYITVGLVIWLVILSKFMKSSWYPYIIYYIALGTLYMTTLQGLSVVGSDISRELLMSKLALYNGWDWSLLDPGNTSFIIGWLVPSLSKFFAVEPELVYKVILPLISAFTPVLLYLIFKKQLCVPSSVLVDADATSMKPTDANYVRNSVSRKCCIPKEHLGIPKSNAFYASLFFIFMPVYAMEIGTIGKSMVAETFMALTLWIVFTSWKSWQKCVLMIVTTILTIWSHYTVGILLVAFLVCMMIVKWFVPLFKKWGLFQYRTIASWVIPVTLVVSLIPAGFYYSNASQGIIANTIVMTATGHIFKAHTEQELMVLEQQGALKTYKTDPLLQVGIGRDFMEATVIGKIFRIIQYLTQLLIIIGSLWLLFKHRLYKFRTGFIACISGSFVLLLCCILIPSFASIINMTRWYHATLFFLAPMFVIGFDIAAKRCSQEVMELGL